MASPQSLTHLSHCLKRTGHVLYAQPADLASGQDLYNLQYCLQRVFLPLQLVSVVDDSAKSLKEDPAKKPNPCSRKNMLPVYRPRSMERS